MNNSELDRILKSARVPEPPAEYWHGFPAAVVRRLRQGDGGGAAEAECRPTLPFWGLGLATACLLIGFCVGLGPWPARQGSVSNAPLARDLAVFRELRAVFPNLLRAVVTDEDGVRLELSERPDVLASTVLWIRISRGERSQSVVTFSGQTIELAGVALEVLADAEGHVLLVGERAVWSSAEGGVLLADGKVEARVLETVL